MRREMAPKPAPQASCQTNIPQFKQQLIMTNTVKGLPEVKVDHIRVTGTENTLINGVESKKKLLQGRSTLKETKLAA